MTQQKPFDLILSEIFKRKRKSVPDILLTGKMYDSCGSDYNIIRVDKTLREQTNFRFPEPTSFGCINFKDFETELLYLKPFTKTNPLKESDWTHFTKGTGIIKITDLDSQVFYMYIKVYLKGHNNSSDDYLKYRIVYSSSFDDLVTSIYKPKEIPDFLNSEAFASKEDKTIEQLTILKEHNESFIKTAEYSGKSVKTRDLSGWMPFDGIVTITVDSKTRTITATTSVYTYSTKYKLSHDLFANDLITKGSNTTSVDIYVDNCSIDIIISNDIGTIKTFWLKQNESQVVNTCDLEKTRYTFEELKKHFIKNVPYVVLFVVIIKFISMLLF